MSEISNQLKKNVKIFDFKRVSASALEGVERYVFTKHRNHEKGCGSMSQLSFMSVPFLLCVSQCSWK